MITASDMAAVIGKCKYNKPIKVIRKKCGIDDKFTGNKFTEWGIKYEEIATKIYEIDYNTKVIEFGLIQHPQLSFIGASPDGITQDGIMLEIKCPYSRVINGKPSKKYYSQIQGQLESLHMDAGNKGQKIGELQRESMTFKSMVEESNKVVTQLKVVRRSYWT